MMTIPQIQGGGTIYIYDNAAEGYIKTTPNWTSSVYTFVAPAWNRWYWIGVYDPVAGEFVGGVWVIHNKTHG